MCFCPQYFLRSILAVSEICILVGGETVLKVAVHIVGSYRYFGQYNLPHKMSSAG